MKPVIKKSHFRVQTFFMLFGGFLLMSGIHTGLIVGVNTLALNEWVSTSIVLGFWVIIAFAFTVQVSWLMQHAYEKPMKEIAVAAGKVADGDFSVYVPTIHTADKMDYIDQMILDFNKMVEELGSIETLKTDFVSNVSHEMKTPIAIIKNYAEVLQGDSVAENTRVEYAKIIEDAATRLSNLISNILKLNKLENQRIVPEMESYDVCRQLSDCILQFENVWEDKGLELEVDMEDMALIRADASLMELVWNNLLSNAVKFTEAGGYIAITQQTKGERVCISVQDNGCGMSKETRESIFDKFYQGDTSHATEGNGLGLAAADYWKGSFGPEGPGIMTVHPDCQRTENGYQTTNHSNSLRGDFKWNTDLKGETGMKVSIPDKYISYPVIDPARGIIISYASMIVEGSRNDIFRIAEVFLIRDGCLKRILAMFPRIHNNGGWEQDWK